MDERRKELLGAESTDDADARGEHVYPDAAPAVKQKERDGEGMLSQRDAGGYVAGADGTQQIQEEDTSHKSQVTRSKSQVGGSV